MSDELLVLAELYAVVKKSREEREMVERRLRGQGAPLKKFWIDDYETKAGKYWNDFYKRNQRNFFKDRHYLDVEFASAFSKRISHLVELGCGVGNAALPLLKHADFMTCLDFSKEAIDLLKTRPDFDAEKCEARVCDLVNDDVGFLQNSADVVTCFFVLSALSPETQPIVAKKIATMLTGKSCVLVRDYGRYDEAQLRFKKNQKLAEHFYVKADGTRCFYFDTHDLDNLFRPLGFKGHATFLHQTHTNRATRHQRSRVFIQATYYYPSSLHPASDERKK